MIFFFKQWITQEIEISVGLAEGRLTLSKLIDERKDLAGELTRLQEKYREANSNDDEPPSKMKRDEKILDTTYLTRLNDGGNINETSDEFRDLRDKIENIKCDIECKNTQINEIQQMVIEGDQGKFLKYFYQLIKLIFACRRKS